MDDPHNKQDRMGTKADRSDHKKPWKKTSIVLMLSVLVAQFLAYWHLLTQQYDADILMNKLVASERAHLLSNWELDLSICTGDGAPSQSVRSCTSVEKFEGERIQFPARKRTSELKKMFPNATHAILSASLELKELEWLKKHEDHGYITLAIPRSVQNSVRNLTGGYRHLVPGMGANATFTYEIPALLQEKKIVVEYDIESIPWFGPSDFPMALTLPSDTNNYLSLPAKVIFSGDLPNLFLTGFPLMLVGLALILDHSTAFLTLGIYSALRSFRLFPTYFLQNVSTDYNSELAYFYVILNISISAALLLLIHQMSGFSRATLKVRSFFVLLPLSVFCVAAWLFKETSILSFVRKSDSIADLVATVGGCLMLLFGARAFFRLKSTPLTAANSSEKLLPSLDQNLFLLRSAFLAGALMLHASASFDQLNDLTNSTQSTAGNNLKAAHFILLPSLIIASLLNVGSITNRMIYYGQKMGERLRRLVTASERISTSGNYLDSAKAAAEFITREFPDVQASRFEMKLPRVEDPSVSEVDVYEVGDAGRIDLRNRIEPTPTLGKKTLEIVDQTFQLNIAKADRFRAQFIFHGIEEFSLDREGRFYVETITRFLAISIENILNQSGVERFANQQMVRFLGKTHTNDVKLGDNARRNLTTLFMDIRGFTSLCEKASGTEISELMNDYFRTAVPLIQQSSGSIDKYIGDAIMAVFEHAENALQAASLILAAIENLSTKRQAAGKSEISVRIGLHTGEVLVSAIGTTNSVSLTVLGAPVNLAARLESSCKKFGVSCLFSRATFEQSTFVAKNAPIRRLGKVLPPGIALPVEIYELMHETDGHRLDLKIAMRDKFEEGIQHFENTNLPMALEAFEEVNQTVLGDKAAEFYIREIKRYQTSREVFDIFSWNGSIRLGTE
jgi:class 3 adenylate cyclase